MIYRDKTTLIMAEKNDQKLNQMESFTLRKERRLSKQRIKKFISKIPDKDWFNTVPLDEQLNIHREYLFNSWDKSLEVDIFWKEMREKHPGDVALRRSIVLSKIMK